MIVFKILFNAFSKCSKGIGESFVNIFETIQSDMKNTYSQVYLGPCQRSAIDFKSGNYFRKKKLYIIDV